MLTEALTALAAAGGTAVVQAAGTSTWQGFQQAVARWFGHGDDERVSAELDRLDRSANALAGAGDDEADRLRLREEAVWQVRFETAFADLGEQERGQAAEALRALLREHTAPGGVVAGEGQSVGGNVHIRADHGSAAALRMGDVTFGNPPQPGPPQG
ncbi:hypothetical protein [Streptomyces silaceus]|uniref:hypothetical protein n=1 Tax=Streptomyces silaceus TaxID=545123 RepID=UPI0006EBB424|nr:hypothetical protein [Streptomyces silaceus]